MAYQLNSGPTITVPGFSAPSSATVCFWFYALALGGVQRPWGLYDGFELRLDGTTLYSDMWLTGTSSVSTTLAATTIYHIAGRAVSGGGASSLVINGTQVATGTTNASPPQTGTLTIGDRTGSGQPINAIVWDFRMYDRILSIGEIGEIIELRGSDDILNGLIHWYPMDDFRQGATLSGAGTIQDQGSRQINGTPNGSPTSFMNAPAVTGTLWPEQGQPVG
jgi:hypothetical protein